MLVETRMKLFDFHTHHERCGHAKGTIRDYIEAGIEKGLDIIGISDHSPYFYYEKDQFNPNIAMGKSEFAGYVKEVLDLKEEYKDKIEVLLGVESDFFPEHQMIYEQAYAKYPFDYIIGSIHYVEGVSIFNRARWQNMTRKEEIATKDTYYRAIEQSARSGMFQILGHIDAMKGFFPKFSDLPSEALEHTLKVIGQQGLTIEVNTSGKTKDCGGWYPSDDILEKAHFYSVDVTFGSDAHTPDRVGDDFTAVQKKLKEIGYTEWCIFRQKKKIHVPL